MNIEQALAKEGIKLNTKVIDITPGHKLTIRADCPRSYCRAHRADDDKEPLTVEFLSKDYAEWRCRSCLQSGHVGEKPEEKKPEGAAPVKSTAAAPTAPNSLPPDALAFLAAKGMTEEEATRFKLGYDAKAKCIKIPYLENGEIVNHLLVRITDGKSKLENNRIIFWGLQNLTGSSEPVTIAQREIDAIILHARGIPNVIAVPNGGDVRPEANDFDRQPDRFAYLGALADQAKDWGDIRFVFDGDKTGLALRQELARRLGPGRCSEVTLSRGNVSATILEAGKDALCEDVREAKKLPIHGLYEVDQFERELKAYYDYGMSSGVSTGWDNVDTLYTVVPGQLTVVTGIPNSGKSEWLDALCSNLAQKYFWRIAAFSPENGKEAHVMKLAEKRVGMSADPKDKRRMSYDTMLAGAKWVGNFFYFIENTDSMPTLEWILDRAKDAALRYGIKGLIIDPWNRIEKKLGERQNETDYVAESIPKILRFAANYGVHVWLVVHPKQQLKDKKGNIPAPSLYDMAGSAHFVNMCDNGIVIHRSESIDDTTEVLVRKVRFKYVGRRGETKLHYDRTTGRYLPLETEISAADREGAEKYRAASGGDIDAMKIYEVS